MGTLADNGGFALTHAVKAGSPVIDVADKNVCAADPINNIDERNVTRPVGAGCDIGAYEFDPQHPGKGFADDTPPVTGVCPTSAPVATATATKPESL